MQNCLFFGQKKIPYGKVNCHDSKSTWLVKDSVFFIKWAAVSISKFEVGECMLWGNKLITGNSFDLEKVAWYDDFLF
jgi:hypothetical protein